MPNFEQPIDNQFAEKQSLWEAKLADVKRIIDGIGGEMDPNIIETVVALNLQNIPTSASCEGHTDHGHPAPWVDIATPERPTIRYNDEKQIYAEILKKYNIKRVNDQAWQEVYPLLQSAGETEEYKKWVSQNRLYREQMDRLVEEYYQTTCNKNERMHPPWLTIKTFLDV